MEKQEIRQSLKNPVNSNTKEPICTLSLKYSVIAEATLWRRSACGWMSYKINIIYKSEALCFGSFELLRKEKSRLKILLSRLFLNLPFILLMYKRNYKY